jgi:hypothetical protein
MDNWFSLDRLRQFLKNGFIVAFLLLVGIDCFPSRAPLVSKFRDGIDPIMDVIAIWQGPWDLFAPGVDKENSWIEVRVYREGDELLETWRSPDWGRISCFGKFVRSREIEFYDRIRNKDNRACWSSYAEFRKKEYENTNQGVAVQRVDLISVTKAVPSQSESAQPVEAQHTTFFTRTFAP